MAETARVTSHRVSREGFPQVPPFPPIRNGGDRPQRTWRRSAEPSSAPPSISTNDSGTACHRRRCATTPTPIAATSVACSASSVTAPVWSTVGTRSEGVAQRSLCSLIPASRTPQG